MNPFSNSFSFWNRSSGCTSKLIFFLFVFGVVLFCTGILLSIFGFQACQFETLTSCNVSLKVLGPSLSVIGLGSILLARSRARLFVSLRQLQGDQVDPDNIFLCGESRQFAQFLIFGFIFLTSGILISVLGVWVPGCSTGWQSQQFNSSSSPSNTDLKGCGLLSLQIMGPLIVLVGLCFFVVAYIKKKHRQESSEDEEQQPHAQEPFHITVGDAVIIFPPPPPPYFADSSTSEVFSSTNSRPVSESPPPYSSIFNSRDHCNFPGNANIEGQEHTHIYSISVPSSSSESLTGPSNFMPEPPPKYEKEPSNSSYSSPRAMNNM